MTKSQKPQVQNRHPGHPTPGAESTVSAATMAHHIKILNDAGLIQVRRQGRNRLLVAQRNTWETYLDCLANLGKAAPVSATDL
jgi:hypothetical protein